MPLPLSPTMPSTLPLSRLKLTPLTAFTSPDGVKKEVWRSLTSSKLIVYHPPQERSFGSKASRRPLPSRLKDSTIRNMAAAAKISSQL